MRFTLLFSFISFMIIVKSQNIDSSVQQKFSGVQKQPMEELKKTSKLGLSSYAVIKSRYLFFTYAMDIERDTRRKNIKMIISHSMFYQNLNKNQVNIKGNMASCGAVIYLPLKRLYFAVPFELGVYIVNTHIFGSYLFSYGALLQTGLRIGWKFNNLNAISLSLNPIVGYGPSFSDDPNIITNPKGGLGFISLPRVSFQFKL